MEPRVYTVPEVAKILRVHFQTVLVLLRTGQLRGGKVGKAWRIPTEAVDEYLRGLSATRAEED